jgi:hypothetical protein
MKKLKQSQVILYRKKMLKSQDGNCAFCGQECKKPCLDHAHHAPYKDKIRGVICNWCNIALGKLENVRVRTGTSWEEFEQSFHKAFIYIHGPAGWKYDEADWHPSKRKSERIAFGKLKAQEQGIALINLAQEVNYFGPIVAKNQKGRVALFVKLNNKTE